MENHAVSTVLAVMGAVCWSVQLIPQIILNYRRHHARGLQSSMMLLWSFAGVPLGVYNIAQDLHIALQIQPQLLTSLSLITWGQCLYYKRKWSSNKTVQMVLLVGALLGGLEVALVFALKNAQKYSLRWPFILMAITSALLLAAGVGRHYVDIWQTRTVRGISFLFVFIDALGDLTSLLSLVFHLPFDTLGAVIYGTELVMWIGVMLCGVFLGRGEKEVLSGTEDVGLDAPATVPRAEQPEAPSRGMSR